MGEIILVEREKWVERERERVPQEESVMVPGLSDSSGLGFDFDLCKRNEFLEKQGLKTLKPWSTGTTICGVVFKVRDEEKARSSDRQIEEKIRSGFAFPLWVTHEFIIRP